MENTGAAKRTAHCIPHLLLLLLLLLRPTHDIDGDQECDALQQ
jgi:hypothetical protein